MNKKTLLVNSIKVLADGQNGEKRFSLRENGEHFCVAVAADDARAEEIKGMKGKEVIATLRDIETADGTPVQQWYLLTDEAVDSYSTREAKRDVNAVIAQKVELQAAQVKVSLADAIKKAGAGALI